MAVVRALTGFLLCDDSISYLEIKQPETAKKQAFRPGESFEDLETSGNSSDG